MGKDKTVLRSVISTSVILGVIFIGFLVFLLFLSKKDNNAENNEIPIPLSEERLIEISQQVEEIKKTEAVRKENAPLNDRPFENGDYSYDERTVDFRLVCKKDCPVSKEILDQEFAATAYAISTLRGLTQSDIDESLMPFEIHASEDIRCPMLEGALAYRTTYYDSNGYTRGLLCFFFDKLYYDRSKFPYTVSVHEVAHLFEEGKVPRAQGENGDILWEGISEMLDSLFVKGNDVNSFCWQGNAWFKEALENSNDAHWVGGNLFFELCKQYGFDYDDLPELFRQLEAKKSTAIPQDFVNIVNDITGKDTSQLFRNAGVIN